MSGAGCSRRVPTTRGAPSSSTAWVISASASGLRVGSMSDAFSGHTTRSGLARVPAATSAAATWVAVTWLSRTWRRWALKSRPARGTLPWTAMTLAGVPSVGSGTANPATRTRTAPASASSAGRAGRWWVRRRSRGPRSQAAAASRPPERATAKVTAGAPPSAASRPNGESAWLKASRTQGKPPYGMRSRSASWATQASATTPGRTLGTAPRPCRYAVPADSRATKRAWQTASPAHGTTPTTVPAQLSE